MSLDALPFIPERFELKPLGDKGAGKQLAVIKLVAVLSVKSVFSEIRGIG